MAKIAHDHWHHVAVIVSATYVLAAAWGPLVIHVVAVVVAP